jgi:YD repeat-containing protein
VTDAVGRVTTYGYDAMSRRTGVFNPAIQGGALLALGYTPDGLLARLADAAGHTTSYTYDGVDRLSATAFPDTSNEALTGACPRAGRRRDPGDANGNVLTRKTRKGDTLTFTYDNLNRLATKTAPGETAVTYGYDLGGRLIGVSDNSAAIKTPAASAGYTATTTWDAMNRPLQVSWSPAPAQAAPTASTATFGFGYDATNRRISATATDKSWWSYPAAAGTTAYTANNLNQYSAVGPAAPTYDQNGNLTYDGTFTYGYDAENRLTSIKQGTNTVATYGYDAQGRRKSKTVGATTRCS